LHDHEIVGPRQLQEIARNCYHPRHVPDSSEQIRVAAPTEVMSIDDLALSVQVSKSRMQKPAEQGQVPIKKLGRHWRFHMQVVVGRLAVGQSAH